MVGEYVHDIFKTNFIRELNVIQRSAKLHLTNGQALIGTIYTIDPVSQSIILLSQDDLEQPSIKIVMKHSISSMEIIPDSEGFQNISFNRELQSITSDVVDENRKEKVKNWLTKNLIPVTEVDNILKVDSLEIHSPYEVDYCFSCNPIVLSRIQNLLEKMPPEDN